MPLRELFGPSVKYLCPSVNYLMPLREIFHPSSCRLCYDLSATNFTSQVKKLSVVLTIASTTQIPGHHLCYPLRCRSCPLVSGRIASTRGIPHPLAHLLLALEPHKLALGPWPQRRDHGH